MKIGVAGLGSMGFGMAASLLRAGQAVCGPDVNTEAADRLAGQRQGLLTGSAPRAFVAPDYPAIGLSGSRSAVTSARVAAWLAGRRNRRGRRARQRSTGWIPARKSPVACRGARPFAAAIPLPPH